MSDIDQTLTERGSRYGNFSEHARVTQAIKSAMIDSPNWASLASDQREALEMIAHKAGRILNGDPDYHDSWYDIIGYTKLVADRLDPNSQIPDTASLASGERSDAVLDLGEPREVGGFDEDRDGPVNFR